ncbi:hypothetical protein D3C85_703310 [compost metagenome]
MNIAVADLAVEVLVIEHGTTWLVELGLQMAVGGVRRGVGQGDARQRVEVAKTGTGQAQA